MSIGFGQERKREPGDVIFHPMRGEEYNMPQAFGNQMPQQLGTRPKYRDFTCGGCGKNVHGRVVCDVIRKSDGSTVLWCLCPCEGATVIVEKEGQVIMQVPASQEFVAGADWPPDLTRLFDEASKSYSAGAYTASAMASRKVLMACACNKGEPDGQSFQDYVTYITDKVLTFPDAKASLDKIRKIGNDANHHIEFVNQADAARALRIVTYMLTTIYSFAAAAN